MKLIQHIRIFTLLFISQLCTNYCFAQDFSFSQFYEKPILRNPALAGIFDGDLKVTAIFKNQWQSVTVPYQTSGLSVENRFKIGESNDFITLGLQATLDKAGDIQLKRTQLMPVINYHKSLNEDYGSYLSLAFMPAFTSSQFDVSKMQFDDQYVLGTFNPNNVTQQTFNRTSFNYWDLSTGLTYGMSISDNTDMYIGIALFHFNKPKIAYYTNNESTTLQNKFSINGGLSTAISDVNRLVLFFDYINQGANKSTVLGGYYGFDLKEDYTKETNDKFTLYLGSFYRIRDAIVPVVKLDYYRFTVGLSYDINISQLKSASQMRGCFELSYSQRTN
ncbi:MAG: PorP/SprF family type IX secretion system membrane protein [Dolichospermum sp.]